MGAKTYIRSSQSWLRFDWHELLHYRDLLWFLVRRDFVAIYKQTILGPLWFVIQPVAMTVVFTIIFGEIGGIGTDNMPKMIFYMSGIMLWNYHQACLTSVSSTLIGNSQLLTKVYFPRLIIPLSAVLSNMFQLGISTLIFSGFWLYFKFYAGADIHIDRLIWLFPVLIIQSGLIGLGFGLWIAALTTKYRDLNFAVPFITQLWMFATPVVWPASRLLAEWKQWEWVMWLNPLSAVVELNRFIFTGKGTVMFSAYGMGWLITIVILLTGLIIFNRIQRTFVDTI